MIINVGIGEMAVSRAGDELVTYALGSCVAVCMYDPFVKVGGMVHIALPESQIYKSRSDKTPGYYADTALPALLALMRDNGAVSMRIWVKIMGGAAVLENMTSFNIGKRNILAITKGLWQLQMGIIKRDVGGNISRTVNFRLDDGRIRIKNKGNIWEL